MNHKRDIIDMVKRLAHHRRRLRARPLIHPQRDWLIGLLLFTSVIVGGAVINFFSHQTTQNISVDSFDIEVEPVKYDADTVREAIALFSEKQAFVQSMASTPIISHDNTVPVSTSSPSVRTTTPTLPSATSTLSL